MTVRLYSIVVFALVLVMCTAACRLLLALDSRRPTLVYSCNYVDALPDLNRRIRLTGCSARRAELVRRGARAHVRVVPRVNDAHVDILVHQGSFVEAVATASLYEPAARARHFERREEGYDLEGYLFEYDGGESNRSSYILAPRPRYDADASFLTLLLGAFLLVVVTIHREQGRLAAEIPTVF